MSKVWAIHMGNSVVGTLCPACHNPFYLGDRVTSVPYECPACLTTKNRTIHEVCAKDRT